MFSKDDKHFYLTNEKLINQNVKNARIYIKNIEYNKGKINPKLELGQKLIQLKIHDIENIGNIKYEPWREIFIGYIVSNIVVNGQSPNFPLFKDWFIIRGNNKNIWDNKKSIEKIKNSEQIKEVINHLEKINKGLYSYNKTAKRNIYINNNFYNLHNAINLPISYAEEEIILAEYILVLITENLDNTLADLPELMKSRKYSRNVGFLFHNYEIISGLVFGYIYGLYCLNKSNIIHGDLHYNNATIFKKVNFYNVKEKKQIHPNSKIIYNIKNKNYIFPNQGTVAGIIDFSRSIIDEKLINKNFPKEAEQINFDQKLRVIRIIEDNFNEFYNKNKAKIQTAVHDEFETVFKILTAVDAFRLMNAFLFLINTKVLNTKEYLQKYADEKMLTEKLIHLLKKIIGVSHTYFISNFIKLFEKTLDKNQIESNNYVVITECFKEFDLDLFDFSKNNISLTDYFSSETEIKYDCRDKDNLPPCVKIYEEHEYLDNVIDNNLDDYYEMLEKEKTHPIEMEINEIKEEVKNKDPIENNDIIDEIKKEVENE